MRVMHCVTDRCQADQEHVRQSRHVEPTRAGALQEIENNLIARRERLTRRHGPYWYAQRHQRVVCAPYTPLRWHQRQATCDAIGREGKCERLK